MTDATTAQLLAEAQTAIESPRTRIAESERAYEHAIWNLINVARHQDARIAALEGDLRLLNNIHFDQLTARTDKIEGGRDDGHQSGGTAGRSRAAFDG